MIEITLTDATGAAPGADAIARGLTRLLWAAGDVRPALEDLGEALLRSTLARFDQGQDPGGSPWAPVSPGHLLFKRKHGFSEKTLQMRGHLRGGLVWQVQGQTLYVGTNLVYAAVHQFGGTVHQGARSGNLRLRTDRQGNLMRRGNLATFARAGHKLAVTRAFQVGPHSVEVPARPFLGLSLADQAEGIAILRGHVLEALNKT